MQDPGGKLASWAYLVAYVVAAMGHVYHVVLRVCHSRQDCIVVLLVPSVHEYQRYTCTNITLSEYVL